MRSKMNKAPRLSHSSVAITGRRSTVSSAGAVIPERCSGSRSAFTDDQLVSLIDGSATATYTLTGVNGETLNLAMTFQSAAVDGGVTFAGSYTIAGGSGRFEGATGSGLLAGGALFLTETHGIGSFCVAGTISLPGN